MDRELNPDEDMLHVLWQVTHLIKLFLNRNELTFSDMVWRNRHGLYHCYFMNECDMCPDGRVLPQKRILTRQHLQQLNLLDTRRQSKLEKAFYKSKILLDDIDIKIAHALVKTCDEMFWYFCTELQNKKFDDLFNEHKTKMRKLCRKLTEDSLQQHSDRARNVQHAATSCSFCQDKSNIDIINSDIHDLDLFISRKISWKQLYDNNQFVTKRLLEIFSPLKVELIELFKLEKEFKSPPLRKRRISTIEKLIYDLSKHVSCKTIMIDGGKMTKYKRSPFKVQDSNEINGHKLCTAEKVSVVYHVIPIKCKSKYKECLETRKVIPPTPEIKTAPTSYPSGRYQWFTSMFDDEVAFPGNLLFTSPQARVTSFQNWPIKHFWPNHLAEAGFFYTGSGGIVQCYSCDFTDSVENWKPSESALAIHARKSPKCEYIISLGLGKPTTEEGEVNNNTKEQDDLEAATAVIFRESTQHQVKSTNTFTSPYNSVLTQRKTSFIPPLIPKLGPATGSYNGNNVADHLSSVGVSTENKCGIATDCGPITQETDGRNYANDNVFSPDGFSIGYQQLRHDGILTTDSLELDLSMKAISDLHIEESTYYHDGRLEENNDPRNARSSLFCQRNNMPVHEKHPEPDMDNIIQSVDMSENLSMIFRYPEYQYFNSRMYSYVGWQHSDSIKPEVLSKAGFFFTGEADIVRCFCCDLGMAEWHSDDDAWLEHARHSADCWFLTKEKGEDYVKGVQTQWKKIYSPKHPDYEDKKCRLKTFRGQWRTDIQQTPEILAEAGFFFTGEEDIVRCHYCDGGLRNWEPNDVPWEEHARWFPFCKYVLKVKGKEYTDSVRLQYETKKETNRNAATTDADGAHSELENDPKKLKEDNQLLKDQFVCRRCKANDSNIVFRSCGHRVVCEECSNKIDRCLICDKKIKGRIKTFLA